MKKGSFLKTSAMVSIAVAAFFVWAIASESEYVETGGKAGNFRLNDQHMEVVELEKLRGTPVAIIYTGRKGFDDSAEIINNLEERYYRREGEKTAEKKIHVVGAANLNGLPFFLKKKVKSHMKKNRYPSFLMDWKGEIAASYGYDEKGIAVFVVDEKGIIRFSGNVENTSEDIGKLTVFIDSMWK